MNGYLKQSTASQARLIGPFIDDTDFKTAETGLTIANTDIILRANGTTLANKNSGGGTHQANGMYSVTWDATDTANVGELFFSVKVAGALQVFGSYVVLEEAVYDALFGASAAGYQVPIWAAANSTVNLSATTIKTATDVETDTADIQSRLPAALTAGGNIKADVDTVKTQTVTCAAGVTVLASVGTAATSTAQTGDAFARLGAPAGASVSADVAAVKADTAAILVDTGTDGVVVAAGSKTGYSLTATTGLGNQTADITGTISTVTNVTNEVTANVTKISGSAAAADALEESTEAIAYGTVDGTGATTTVFLSSALTPDSAANDQFLGRVLIFKSDTTTANLRGQATTITDYAHTSAEIGTFTVTALTTAPSTGDTFVIL